MQNICKETLFGATTQQTEGAGRAVLKLVLSRVVLQI